MARQPLGRLELVEHLIRSKNNPRVIRASAVGGQSMFAAWTACVAALTAGESVDGLPRTVAPPVGGADKGGPAR